MILLDTNVVSALMQSRPEPLVVAWLDRQAPEDIWTTSITVFEVRYGLDRLQDSRRADRLRAAFDHLLEDELENRVAAVDRLAAEAAAGLAAERSRRGRTVEIRDTLIAGIALARQAMLATRNLNHFDDSGASLIDPWTLLGMIMPKHILPAAGSTSGASLDVMVKDRRLVASARPGWSHAAAAIAAGEPSVEEAEQRAFGVDEDWY